MIILYVSYNQGHAQLAKHSIPYCKHVTREWEM